MQLGGDWPVLTESIGGGVMIPVQPCQIDKTIVDTRREPWGMAGV
jgi:hypothetical protein